MGKSTKLINRRDHSWIIADLPAQINYSESEIGQLTVDVTYNSAGDTFNLIWMDEQAS